MKGLIACEESQEVCKAFRKKGVETYSCDILPCSGGHPEWHIQGNVVPILGKEWDFLIAFPPCTHLAVSGARHFEKKRKDGRQKEGVDFFMLFTRTKIKRWAIENPVGIMSRIYRRPDQTLQPWYFGDEYQKTTCLWLSGLPPLLHQNEDDLFGKKTHSEKGKFYISPSGRVMPEWYSNATAKERSKTFPGIARAMADQWSKVILQQQARRPRT